MPRCLPIRATSRGAVNTVLFVGLAVNVQMVLALLLSGFFARRRWWIKALLVVYILPWTLPAVPAYLSFHWMLVAYPQGLLDNLITAMFGIEGPFWFNHGWLALDCDIVADVWKWMPLWTLIFLGGRMAIPQDLYDAADVDGASPYQRFAHVTLPLLANLYIVSTLIATIWAFGDYAPVLFISARHTGVRVRSRVDARLPLCARFRQPAARRGRRPVGAAAADPRRDPAAAAAARRWSVQL